MKYHLRAIAGAGAGMCPDTQDLRDSVMQDICSLFNSGMLPLLGNGSGHGACDCGGPGWRRAVYLDMSDPTQTCHQLGSSLVLQKGPVLDPLMLEI